GFQTLSAVLSTPSGTVVQDTVSVQFVPTQVQKGPFLTASRTLGEAPLAADLKASYLGVADAYRWDADGDGVIDSTGLSQEITAYYPTPGLYFPTVVVTDAQGAQASDVVPVSVLAPGSLFTLLQTKWQALKNALLAGDIPAALQFVARHRQEKYR